MSRQKRSAKDTTAQEVNDYYDRQLGRGAGGHPKATWREVENKEDRAKESEVPEHVLNACWKAALKQYGGKHEIPNPEVRKDYATRVKQWEKREEEKRAGKQQRREKQQARGSMRESYGLAPTPKTAPPVLIEEVDDWEELCDEDKMKVPLEHTSHPANFVKGVVLNNEEGPLTIEMPHGHKVLAATRSFGDQAMRCGCLAAALRDLRDYDRPVIVDVGAGASGVKNAVRLLTETLRADEVYHHCIFPIASSADVARDRLLRNPEVAGKINWVDAQHQPKMGKVNVCRHTAATCTCLAFYDTRHVFTCHSHYYFTQADWYNLFNYTDMVRTYGHYQPQ